MSLYVGSPFGQRWLLPRQKDSLIHIFSEQYPTIAIHKQPNRALILERYD